MKKSISEIVDFWPIITALFFLTFFASSVFKTQEAHALKIEKLEMIKDDINQIKIKIERIETTLEQINKNKGR